MQYTNATLTLFGFDCFGFEMPKNRDFRSRNVGQRFHFDLMNGEELIRDDEGIEASSPDEAIKEARAALADMRASEDAPASGEGWRLIVRDERGMTVGAISLNDDVLQAPAASDRAVPLQAIRHGLKGQLHSWSAMIIVSPCLICL